MKPPLIIGNATLYHARCEDVFPTIQPGAALVTDFPYLIKTAGAGKFRKARKNLEKIEAAGISKGFDIKALDLSPYRSVVGFCHNDQVSALMAHLEASYDRVVLCFWEKTNPIPMANKNYQANIEPYLHAWNKGDAFPTGKLEDLKRFIRTKNGASEFDHPTVKPDAVMDKIMLNVNGDTVIDPYAGTGSTGIAALKQGKKFIGIEENAQFFNIMVSRIMMLGG